MMLQGFQMKGNCVRHMGQVYVFDGRERHLSYVMKKRKMQASTKLESI